MSNLLDEQGLETLWGRVTTLNNNTVSKITAETTARQQADSGLQASIDKLNGTGEGSVTKTVTDKIAEVVAGAPADFDTLKEMSDWITSHTDSAAEMNTAIQGKVDKVEGKGLSTEDYTSAEKTKLAGIATGANKITVDTALSATSTNPVQNKVINTALGNKVDKVTGKGLSTNDYTTAEKTKLSGIAEGANKTTVDAALSTTSTNPVQNSVITNEIDGIKTDYVAWDTCVAYGSTEANKWYKVASCELTAPYSAIRHTTLFVSDEIGSTSGILNLCVRSGSTSTLTIDSIEPTWGCNSKTDPEDFVVIATLASGKITAELWVFLDRVRKAYKFTRISSGSRSVFGDDNGWTLYDAKDNGQDAYPTTYTTKMTSIVYNTGHDLRDTISTEIQDRTDGDAALQTQIDTVNTALGNKVDKVSGKGLSTNDFTTALKTKLDGIATGANKTTVDTALSSTSTNPVQNKVIYDALAAKLTRVEGNAYSSTTSGTNWYKAATYTVVNSTTVQETTFDVFMADGTVSNPISGRLMVTLIVNASKVITSASARWVVNPGFDPECFSVVTSTDADGVGVADLWIKISKTYTAFKLSSVESSNRTTIDSSFVWTLLENSEAVATAPTGTVVATSTDENTGRDLKYQIDNYQTTYNVMTRLAGRAYNNTSTTTAKWYKVATYVMANPTSANTMRFTVLNVADTYADRGGLIMLRVTASAGPTLNSVSAKWLSNSGIDPDNFVISASVVDDTVVVDLWACISIGWSAYLFTRDFNSTRASITGNEDDWTFHDPYASDATTTYPTGTKVAVSTDANTGRALQAAITALTERVAALESAT